MASKLIALVGLVLVVLFLAGCSGSGGGGSTASFNSPSSGLNSFASDDQGSTSNINAINPEPATIALLGGGFVAYVLLKRRKRL